MRAPAGLWYGSGPVATSARALLSPAERAYGAVVALRNRLYDAGALPTAAAAVPVASVGNLTVGGTGKTPITAWIAEHLAAAGARPAIVLRGYGDDEPLVHRLLNPDVPAVVAPDRAAGVRAAVNAGADVVVLDDGFQHRRLRRTLDVVLLAAEQWREPQRLLPAGPWRESLAALRRASLVLITRKASSIEAARHVAQALRSVAPAPVAIAHLDWDALHVMGSTDAAEPLDRLRGKRVLGVAAVGDPAAFAAQLEACGATIRLRAFTDHHRFTPGDALRLAREADAGDAVVCTLKDAVKLAPLWPRQATPLWYVSQRVSLEDSADAVHAALSHLLAARGPVADRTHPTAHPSTL